MCSASCTNHILCKSVTLVASSNWNPDNWNLGYSQQGDSPHLAQLPESPLASRARRRHNADCSSSCCIILSTNCTSSSEVVDTSSLKYTHRRRLLGILTITGSKEAPHGRCTVGTVPEHTATQLKHFLTVLLLHHTALQHTHSLWGER